MSELTNLKPGEQLTQEQKAKLAKENIASSTEAQRLAAEHQARDRAEGKGEPAVQTVANLLKGKLERGEFESKGTPVPPTE